MIMIMMPFCTIRVAQVKKGYEPLSLRSLFGLEFSLERNANGTEISRYMYIISALAGTRTIGHLTDIPAR